MGLFGKSYEDKIAEIRNMINQAAIDGVITEDEVDKIFKKAQKYGVVDECEQMLEKAVDNLKKRELKEANRAKYSQIKRWIFIGIGAILIMFLLKECFFTGGGGNKKTASDNYSTIEEALANYDFKKARELNKYDALNQDLQKITKAEVSYYCSNDALEKAVSSLTEYNFHSNFNETQNHDKDQYYYNQEVEWYNNTLDIIITKLKLKGQKEKAVSYLEAYAKGKAKYSNTKNKMNYFKKDFSWRDNRINEIK